MNKLEQYSRLNCIEIQGIPESKNEDVLTVVARLHRALDVDFQKNSIDACHRLRAKPGAGQHKAIIVKYVSRLLKEEVIKARKVRRTLCLRDLELDGQIGDMETPIYINESLTGKNKLLLFKCREQAKKEKIKFVWVKNGKIYMRKSGNSNIVFISSEKNFIDVH